MRTTPSAGPKLALALLLTLTLAGCGSTADTRAITALVDRLMGILTSTDTAPRTEDLGGIFTGLDPSGTWSLPEGLAPVPRDVSYTLQALRYLPFGAASVTVALASEGATSTLELKAKRIRGEWRLEPTIHVRQRLDEVKAPGS